MRRIPKIRRHRPTTSWEVHAPGLSTSTKPSATQSLPNHVEHRGGFGDQGEPGGIVVATSTVGLGDGTNVDNAPGAQTDLPSLRGLLEQRRHPGLASDAQVVDEPVEVCPGDRKSTRLNSSHADISHT